MAFTLSRVDAIYSAPFVSPALELVGEIPRLIRAVYQAFADRYPGLPVSAFKALNSNTLSEVGLSISLLEGRLEITLRVDQSSVQATNLRTPAEVRFAQDCVLLMQDFINKSMSPKEGVVNLRIASWLRVDGGKDELVKKLNKIAKPQRTTFNKARIGAETMEHFRSKSCAKHKEYQTSNLRRVCRRSREFLPCWETSASELPRSSQCRRGPLLGRALEIKVSGSECRSLARCRKAVSQGQCGSLSRSLAHGL
jgi:hypothetical protein